ncbi:MAG: hypothetical protein ABH839_01960 [Chloroflexota bacterium]
MEKTCKPLTAGILNIIAGAFTLLGGMVVIILATVMSTTLFHYIMYSAGAAGPVTPGTILSIITILAVCLIVSGIISIVGGVFAIKRRIWGLALAASILSILHSSALGIAAIVLVALGKNEFE